jgi:hypothetical protein
MASRADVINRSSKDAGGGNAEGESPLRSPGAFGGSGGCASASAGAPAMMNKMEQKVIDELEDFSVIDDV